MQGWGSLLVRSYLKEFRISAHVLLLPRPIETLLYLSLMISVGVEKRIKCSQFAFPKTMKEGKYVTDGDNAKAKYIFNVNI